MQRAWSDRAAALGRNPCVPAGTGSPYIALVPHAPAVRLPDVGDTATITVQAAFDRPVEPWPVEVIDLAQRQGGKPCVTAELDRHMVGSGDTARLTLTLLREFPQHLCHLGLVSAQHGRRHLWPLAIVTR